MIDPARYQEFRRVLAYLHGKGVRFENRDGDSLPVQGHTLRRLGEHYAIASDEQDGGPA